MEAPVAPPPKARVLRCCCCRLFQAHQVKKSLKWTCKVCGEKQSFLRAYGEGSGDDCRRHVQKLNLLQGQVSEMSPRSLEEPMNANKEKNAGPGQAEHVSLQGHAGKVKEGSSQDWYTRRLTGVWGELLPPAQQTRTTSKWERFLLPSGNSSHVDRDPLTPRQRDLGPAEAAQAEQRTPRAHTARDMGLSKTPGTFQFPWAMHTPTLPVPKRPFKETPEQLWGTGSQAGSRPLVKQAQEPRLLQLCNLFNTGDDFDDVL